MSEEEYSDPSCAAAMANIIAAKLNRGPNLIATWCTHAVCSLCVNLVIATNLRVGSLVIVRLTGDSVAKFLCSCGGGGEGCTPEPEVVKLFTHRAKLGQVVWGLFGNAVVLQIISCPV